MEGRQRIKTATLKGQAEKASAHEQHLQEAPDLSQGLQRLHEDERPAVTEETKIVDFNELGKLRTHAYPACGQEFNSLAEEPGQCPQCDFQDRHPELRTGYFTWKGAASGWNATARRQENDPEPARGEIITVHRKDGTSSSHAVVGTIRRNFNGAGELHITCTVKNGD